MRIENSYEFNQPRGFAVLEGVNGAGKSTLLKRLLEASKPFGKDLLQTREPGGSDLGKQIRSLVLEASDEPPNDLSELFLFAADRAEHVSKCIRPATENGKLVVSDRYYYSTAAFQGYGRGLELEVVNKVNSIAIQGMLPDFVILLDLDPKIGLARKLYQPEEEDKFEREQLEFHSKLRNGFLELASSCSEPFLVVDASSSSDAVFDQVYPLFERWVKSCS